MKNEVEESITSSYGIRVSGVRVLKKQVDRTEKKGTSIIITIPTEEAEQVTPQIILFGRYRKANVMWRSSPNMQCGKCQRFGHPEEGCRNRLHTCAICSQKHKTADHRCTSQSWPEKGNTKLVVNCCPITQATCPNCRGSHSAKDDACPVKVEAKRTAEEIFRTCNPNTALVVEVTMD